MRVSQDTMKHIYGWLLLTPAAILLIAFTYYPTVATFIDSFYSKGIEIKEEEGKCQRWKRHYKQLEENQRW